ncbi:hypothetical protein CE11_00788 [Megavirus courdo11]|nr:hypothetical protein CE11_00788 [Megavirus courdo11]
MVIIDSQVYEIMISEKSQDKYFLVIGDLQVKSGVIRRLDPGYKFENILREQTDFLDRIKAKEKAKIQEFNEELEEIEDLEDINEDINEDISDIDDNSKNNST